MNRCSLIMLNSVLLLPWLSFADLEAICRVWIQNSLIMLWHSRCYTVKRGCWKQRHTDLESRLLTFVLIWANAVGGKLLRPMFLKPFAIDSNANIYGWCYWILVSFRVNEGRKHNKKPTWSPAQFDYLLYLIMQEDCQPNTDWEPHFHSAIYNVYYYHNV